MTPDPLYVSWNFNNPELKKIGPCTGTHKRPLILWEFEMTDVWRERNNLTNDRYQPQQIGKREEENAT